MGKNRNDDGSGGGMSFGGSGDESSPSDPTIRPLGHSTGSEPTKRMVDTDLCGQVLHGKYRVVKLIGRGTFGSVYEAIDEGLGAKVAIKVLTHDAASEPSSIEQFLHEAKQLTQLDHPYVVRWITFDRTPGGLPYFVMELLRGQELFVLLRKEGRLSFPRAARMLLQILEALEVAHFLPDKSEAGEGDAGGTTKPLGQPAPDKGTAGKAAKSILHLDLKPANVFVIDGQQETVKVIDFGISQHVGATARSAAGRGESAMDVTKPTDLSASISAKRLPNDGKRKVDGKPVMRARGGTISYASPEQCMHLLGEEEIVPLDGRADLYSVGIIGFEMLTGQLPWQAKSVIDAVEAHCKKPVPRLAAMGVKAPRAFQKFLDRCLAKNRDERFPSVREARQALHRIVHPPSKLPILAAALLLVAVGVIWWQSMQKAVLKDRFQVVGQQLFVGPKQLIAKVEVGAIKATDREAGPGKLSAQVVSEEDSSTPIPGDWKATIDKNAKRATVELLDKDAFRRHDVLSKVVLRAGIEDVQVSDPFSIVYLDEDSWRIGGKDGQVQIKWGDRKAITLASQNPPEEIVVDADHGVLHVPLASDLPEFGVHCVESVKARFEGVGKEGDWVLLESGVNEFTVPLTRLIGATGVLDGGRRMLLVRAQDKAGNEKTLQVESKFFSGVSVLALSTSARMSAGRYVVNQGSPIQLFFEVNRQEAGFSHEVWLVREATGKKDKVALERETKEPLNGGGSTRVGFRCVLPVDLEEQCRMELSVFHVGAKGTEPPDPRVSISKMPLNVGNHGDEVIKVRPRGGDRTGNFLEWTTLYSERDLGTKAGDGPSEPATLWLPGSGEVLFTNAATAQVRLVVRWFEEAAEVGSVRLSAGNRGQLPLKLAGDLEERKLSWAASFASEAKEVPPFAKGIILVKRDSISPELKLEEGWPLLVKPGGPKTLCKVRAVDKESGVHKVLASWSRGKEAPVRLMNPVVDDSGLYSIDGEWGNLPDGKHVLHVDCVDQAGNEVSRDFEFDVQLTKPSVSLSNPSGGTWGSVEGGKFRVEFVAKDGNGIADVSVVVAGPGNYNQRLDGQASPCVLNLPSSLIGKDVTVTVEAKDTTGESGMAAVKVTVDSFEPALPPRISVAGASFIGGMILVKGAENYRHGLIPDDEKKITRPEKLGESSPDGDPLMFRTSSVHDMPQRNVRVGSFYLDEREVSVRQLRQFLLDPACPEEVGRRLTARFPEDSDEVAMGIEYGDAELYAKWAGKRLPTALEWEFAVRGGLSYRFWSFDPGTGGSGDVERCIQDVISAKVRLSKSPQDDVTIDPKGIRGLCSGAGEWLASADKENLFLIQPGPALFFSWTLHPQAVARYDVSQMGFRCALDAATIESPPEGAARKFVGAH